MASKLAIEYFLTEIHLNMFMESKVFLIKCVHKEVYVINQEVMCQMAECGF